MNNDRTAIRPPILLVAEDEPMISDLISLILQESGFDVVCVDRGIDAIAELDRAAQLFAGLVTDIRMGPGQDGWAVAKRARELMPEMAVVYVSADSEAKWATHGVPGSVMVPKPFAPSEIVTAISSLLNVRLL